MTKASDEVTESAVKNPPSPSVAFHDFTQIDHFFLFPCRRTDNAIVAHRYANWKKKHARTGLQPGINLLLLLGGTCLDEAFCPSELWRGPEIQ